MEPISSSFPQGSTLKVAGFLKWKDNKHSFNLVKQTDSLGQKATNSKTLKFQLYCIESLALMVSTLNQCGTRTNG